jgi:hypothetical protein
MARFFAPSREFMARNGERLSAARQASFPFDFILVARFEASDFEEAFEITNTIHSRWYENPEITMVDAVVHRSSMVGDVFEVNGELRRCEPVGWSSVEVSERVRELIEQS